MAQIQNFTDVTGKMTPGQINSANIDNIIQELNRNSDQLDALNNVLSVIAYGSLTYSWDGSVTSTILTAPFQTSGASYSTLTYMSRSTDSPTLYFNLPYRQIGTNANNDSVVFKDFYTYTEVDNGQLNININFTGTGSPIVYTFHYIVVQQPTVTST